MRRSHIGEKWCGALTFFGARSSAGATFSRPDAHTINGMARRHVFSCCETGREVDCMFFDAPGEKKEIKVKSQQKLAAALYYFVKTVDDLQSDQCAGTNRLA
jgi:hypothetical protein